MLAGALGVVYLAVNTARAEEMARTKASPYAPAVDGINAKIEGIGGSLANHGIYGSKGAISIPLGGSWGAQIDGTAGSFDQRFFGSIAGHLFWRNPQQGLLGIYANYTHLDEFGGAHVTQFAGEGEYYWNRWTLQGIAGVEFGNKASQTTTTTSTVPPVPIGFGITTPGVATTNTFTEGYDVKTRFFDQVNLKYYLTDNWDAYVGHRYLGGKNALALGSEYALPLGRGVMASAFVEGNVGEHDFHGVWGGLRFYFGASDKTLIARHRQDDPNIWDSLFSIINSYFTNGSSSSSQFCNDGAILSNNQFGPNECFLLDSR
jgi:hypothetical protein